MPRSRWTPAVTAASSSPSLPKGSGAREPPPAPVNRPPPRPHHGRANPACPYPIPPTYMCSSFYSNIYFTASQTVIWSGGVTI